LWGESLSGFNCNVEVPMRQGLFILAAGVLVLAPAIGQQIKEEVRKGPVSIKERSTLREHKGPVYVVAFHSGGKMLASCSEDTTIKLWEVRTGQERATL
jgi:WD40 repeat protein